METCQMQTPPGYSRKIPQEASLPGTAEAGCTVRAAVTNGSAMLMMSEMWNQESPKFTLDPNTARFALQYSKLHLFYSK